MSVHMTQDAAVCAVTGDDKGMALGYETMHPAADDNGAVTLTYMGPECPEPGSKGKNITTLIKFTCKKGSRVCAFIHAIRVGGRLVLQ